MEIVLQAGDGVVLAQVGERQVAVQDLAAFVREYEAHDGVRWVWDSTASWYPALVADVRVRRCHDLHLARVILLRSALAAAAPGAPDAEDDVAEARRALAAEGDGWDWDGGWGSAPEVSEEPEALFAVVPPEVPAHPRDASTQWRLQQDLLAAIAAVRPGDAHRLRLLLAAESSGALSAVELRSDGLPFRVDLHAETLTALLGPRPAPGARPEHLERLAAQIRDLLGAPTLNPDSQPHLLRELRRNGMDVASTSRWELRGQVHPVVEPLMEYKKLARLASANGWHWMDTWVQGERFRADYVPGGVVTGRWSSRGGGALSLPKVIRRAVVADEGWTFVVADAAQLEPRILAAMSGDAAMLSAGARGDLYQGLVDAGVVAERAHAKVGMLGVLYGGTTGQAAAILPRIARAYPLAMGMVDGAARQGEAGEVVTTWLGRSSPKPSPEWFAAQQAALGAEAESDERSRARSRSREWGRFTRNFVVQGTAAEWALAWLAGVRLRLRTLGHTQGHDGDAPHLAFFLHDELVVHTPAALAEAVADALIESADAAARLLFPHLPAFGVPLDIVTNASYDVDSLPD